MAAKYRGQEQRQVGESNRTYATRLDKLTTDVRASLRTVESSGTADAAASPGADTGRKTEEAPAPHDASGDDAEWHRAEALCREATLRYLEARLLHLHHQTEQQIERSRQRAFEKMDAEARRLEAARNQQRVDALLKQVETRMANVAALEQKYEKLRRNAARRK